MKKRLLILLICILIIFGLTAMDYYTAEKVYAETMYIED